MCDAYAPAKKPFFESLQAQKEHDDIRLHTRCTGALFYVSFFLAGVKI